MVDKFINSEDGQGVLEYMWLLVLVAVVVIVGVTILGLALKDYYNNTANSLAAPLGG